MKEFEDVYVVFWTPMRMRIAELMDYFDETGLYVDDFFINCKLPFEEINYN